MTQKKSSKSAPKGYKFNAIDGDKDGFVQDSTDFERPVGTELFEEPAPEEFFAEELSKLPATHTVLEGENIMTVAQQYLPAGKTRNEYAQELYALNGDFHVGKVIRLV